MVVKRKHIFSPSSSNAILISIRRLYQVWQKHLGAQFASRLQTSGKITGWDGDITQPALGLSEKHIQILRSQVDYFIHTASSINLAASLSRITPSVILATLEAARLALGCKKLAHFVYVSTAYVNAHLHDLVDGTDHGTISEDIHPLKDGSLTLESASSELKSILESGMPPDPTTLRHFPWAYAYAKHLTERLLRNLFTVAPGVESMHDASSNTRQENQEERLDLAELTSDALPNRESTSTSDSETAASTPPIPSKPSLLILRPSCIGPALQSPFPHYSIARSTPLTGVAAAFITSLDVKPLLGASPHDNALSENWTDEIPVDVVVNRLLLHLAAGTQGVVHAACGGELARQRATGRMFVAAANRERVLPWRIRVARVHPHGTWDVQGVCPVDRLFKVFGTRFDFGDVRTGEVLARMLAGAEEDKRELEQWPMFAPATPIDFESRRVYYREIVEMVARKKNWPKWTLNVLCKRSRPLKLPVSDMKEESTTTGDKTGTMIRIRRVLHSV